VNVISRGTRILPLIVVGALGAAGAAVVLSACASAPPMPSPLSSPDARNPAAIVGGATYRPEIDPDDFVPLIDHPYMPLEPGRTMIYEGGGERVEVTVTDETKVVMGVTVTVVRDQVFRNGNLIEDTFDWFAQDRDGNVWYFGEETHRVENGQPTSRAGSWEAGKDGAQPGIVMLGRLAIGDHYRQEYLPGEAEDMGRIRATGESVDVPIGSFTDVLVTEDFTPLEPGIVELKYYAPGIGLLMEETISGGSKGIQLIEVQEGE
jgi:hypothetical protein